MFQEERMQLIVEHLRKHNRISADDIVALFDVSRDTARRDLIKLEEQDAIIRTRGGAILPLLRKNSDPTKTVYSMYLRKRGPSANSLRPL